MKKLYNHIGPLQNSKKSPGFINSKSILNFSSKTGRVVSPEFRKKVNNDLKKVIIQVNLIRKDLSQVAVDQAIEGNILEIEENINHCVKRLSEVSRLVTVNQLLKRVKRSDSFAEKLVKAGKFSSVEEYNEFKKTK
jgi:hypothetical protein